MATFTIDLLTGNLYLFSGNFTGSGSTPTSGSTYPAVNTFADLPTPPSSYSGQIYLVRTASGSFVVNRKDAGLYFSNGSTWTAMPSVPTYFSSANFQVYDNLVNTKGIQFVTSGITSGFKKLTIQNSDGTIAYLTDLNTKLDTSIFATYTGTTAPATFLTKTAFNTFTGTTLPANYYNKTQINAYSGATLLLIGTKLNTSVFNTFTGTTLPANYYNKTQINAYTGATQTVLNNKVNTSTFNAYTGATQSVLNNKLNTSVFATYTGTTAPNTFLKLNQSTPQSVTGGAPKFDAINLNTGYTSTGLEGVGTRYWDANNHTTSLVLENGVVLQDGQEVHIYGKNISGGTIYNGQPVSIVRSNGQFTAFGHVDITTPAAYAFIGLATQDIAHNAFGYVTINGVVRGINTNHLDEGKAVYVNPTGGTTAIYPTVPNYVINVGIVERKHANQGRINVISKIVPKLFDLSDVNGTPLTTTGQIPVWYNPGKYFDFNYNINDYLLKSQYTGSTFNTTLQLLDVSGGTDVNTIASTPIVWTSQLFSGTSLSFTGGSRIYVKASGVYEISYVMNVSNGTGSAKNIGTLIKKNGNVDITPMSTSSYSQNLTNDSSSNTMPQYLVSLANNDYLELVGFRIGNSGTVTTIANGTWIKIRKN